MRFQTLSQTETLGGMRRLQAMSTATADSLKSSAATARGCSRLLAAAAAGAGLHRVLRQVSQNEKVSPGVER